MYHPAELANMRREARAEFEAKYTAEKNYRGPMNIYESATRRAKERALFRGMCWVCG